MASPPEPPRGPGQEHIRKTIRRGFEQIKRAINPSSRSSSPHSGSMAALSTGAHSALPAQAATSGQSTTTQTVPSHGSGNTGQSTGQATVGASPVVVAVNTASPGPTAATNLRESILETLLRGLEEIANWFPPLRAAVANLIDCFDIVQVSYSDPSRATSDNGTFGRWP